MAFSVKPNSPEADKHWDVVKSSIDSIKYGIGKAKDGDSTSWQDIGKTANEVPAEWGLDFPEGKVWILTQQG